MAVSALVLLNSSRISTNKTPNDKKNPPLIAMTVHALIRISHLFCRMFLQHGIVLDNENFTSSQRLKNSQGPIKTECFI